MMHKAWCSTEEVSYCFSRSSIKFEGHMDRKIDYLNPILSKIARLVAAIKSLRFALFWIHSFLFYFILFLKCIGDMYAECGMSRIEKHDYCGFLSRGEKYFLWWWHSGGVQWMQSKACGGLQVINLFGYKYRQVSNIRRTKSQHLKNYRTVLRLSLPNPLKPGVQSRMKM